MLSIANVKNHAHAASYFTKKEDYYLSKEAESSSQWWGKGAATLGLQGYVDHDTFSRLAQGELPNGTKLHDKLGGTRRVATDLTFSAPKSVSVEALVYAKKDVIEAHEKAISVALEYLEERAANTRICSDNKVTRKATDNLVVARFQHHTSRALDPQLHTHCLAMNMTQGKDGTWRALFNDDLYTHKKAAGAVYRAELAERLRMLGYEIRITQDDGRFDLKHYDQEHLKAFSKRRSEIEAALDGALGQKLKDMGLSGAEAAKKANLGTRDRKKNVDPELLREAWYKEAQEIGIKPPEKSRQTQDSPTSTAWPARECVEWAVKHLEERVAVYDEREITRHALERGTGQGVTLKDVSSEMKEQADVRELVATGQRREGQMRYTSDHMLRLEADTIRLMKQGQGRCQAITSQDRADTYLSEWGLKKGQQEAAKLILTNKDFLVGIQGYAGTGKTTMLRPVCRMAEKSGYTIKGLSVSAAAAKELERGAGIKSTTIASHLHSKPDPSTDGKYLWIVDETSFLSTKDAHTLLKRAQEEGSKVVFVGDRDQLPAVEAGQPFVQLQKRGMETATMDEIVRQKNKTALRAVHQTIDREPQKAIETLDKNIMVLEEKQKRLNAVANAYLARDRDETIVVTGSNADRRAINEKIRSGLGNQGILKGDQVESDVLVQKNLTKAQMRIPEVYETGDIVRFNRDYKRLGFVAGEYATVQRMDDEGRVVLSKENGREVAWTPVQTAKVEIYRRELRDLAAGDKIRWTRNGENDRRNGEYAHVLNVDSETGAAVVRIQNGGMQRLEMGKEKHWEHGYAVTVHASQGATKDAVIAHVDTKLQNLMGHELWYVAISRAKHEILVITDDKGNLPRAIRGDMSKESAMEKREEYKIEMGITA